jgi:hypothetical protein
MSELLITPVAGDPLRTAVVRIWSAGMTSVVGAGFLISADQILTCAHVVQIALGRGNDNTEPPLGSIVTLDFPLLDDAHTVSAVPEKWNPKPTESTPEGLDFALLRLTDPPPGATPIPIAEDTDLWQHSFRAFGFPKGYPGGVWARGVVLGNVAGKRVQMVAEDVGHLVAPGFSGGPVWDNLAGGVVGMVVVSDEQRENRSAAMISSRILLEACPELRDVVAPLVEQVELTPPGGPFDPKWHIVRDEEQEALRYLSVPGTPAVIWGPRTAGKSWLVQRLIARLRSEPGGPRHIVEIDLARYEPDVRDSLDRLLKRIATRLVDALGLDRDLVRQAWDPDFDEAPGDRMDRLIEKSIFPRINGQLVLAIERADAIWGYQTQDSFFPLVRAWAGMATGEPWSRLRLLLAVSTTPARLAHGRHNSPFNIVPPVDLRNLSIGQVLELLRLYRLRDAPMADIEGLMELTSGHPYLVRLALFESAVRQRSLAEVLADIGLDSPFGWHLQGYRTWLEDQGLVPSLCGALNDPKTRLTPEAEDALHRAGLIVWRDNEQSYACRYPLYARYFRSHLCR